jgi:ribosomal protein L16/L10AE
LTVAKGGTGATTAAAARTKLGISMIEIKTVSSLADTAESALTFSGAV